MQASVKSYFLILQFVAIDCQNISLAVFYFVSMQDVPVADAVDVVARPLDARIIHHYDEIVGCSGMRHHGFQSGIDGCKK